MRRKLLTTFIFALFLGACGPAMEPASAPPNPLNSDNNSGNSAGDLDDLFGAQDTVSGEENEEQNDTSSDAFGPSEEEPTFIGDGPSPDEVTSEPLIGEPPVYLTEDGGESSPQGPAGQGQDEPASETSSTPEDALAAQEQPPSQPEQAGPEDQNETEDEEPTVAAEDPGEEQNSTEDEEAASASPEPEVPAQEDQEITFTNRDAEKIYLQTVANSSIPFRTTNSLKLFWGRFDAFLDSRYLHQVGPEEREVFKIPRCAGTPQEPVQSRWPNFGPNFAMPPIVPVYVEQIGGVVDINAPLALLDRELVSHNHNLDFPFPYYDVLESGAYFAREKDPILDHYVDNRGDLSYLSLAASKEIFQRTMFHAAQMMTDAKAGLNLATECLTEGGRETVSCPEYTQSFQIHQKALAMQRMALAIASASQDTSCESWLSHAEQLGDRSQCLFNQEITHDPKLWNLRTYYNPLRNLTRRSSDIDHWKSPAALTSGESEILLTLFNKILAGKPSQERWSALLRLRHQALNIYHNITLLFPSLRFVQSAQIDENEFVQALQMVREELDDISLTYESFKNLRLFPLAVLSRLEAEAPVEMCDIAEEVISTWQPDNTLSSLLALDQSFLFIPLEFHRVIPLQALAYNTFEGAGWEYIGQTIYDFAETRGWAFLAAASDENIRVDAVEVIQAADAARRSKGVAPADQANVWMAGSPESLLTNLLTEL